MHDLNTNIIIYPDSYPALQVVRMEIDFRGQKGDFHLGPVRLTDNTMYIGVEERTDTSVARRYPNPVRVVSIEQNQANPDPALLGILRSLALWLEEWIDPIIADALTGATEQLGTTLWSLEGVTAPLGDRMISNDLIDLRSAPAPAEAWAVTVDPVVTIE
jgi:hypothetical protein